MADTKISALTAASALAAADIAPVVQGGANVKATVQQIVTAATGSTAFRGETLTTSKPAIDLAQTWNASGITFTGVKFNATDTASAAGSLLMDLQVGGVSKAYIRKDGGMVVNAIDFLGGGNLLGWGGISAGYNSIKIRAYAQDVADFSGQRSRVAIQSGFAYSWANSADVAGSTDLSIFRDAAQTLAQRNGTNAQTFRLYNTFTDASNYERGFMRWNSNVLEIGAEGAGTGVGRTLALYAPVGGNVTLFNIVSSTPGSGVPTNDVFRISRVASESFRFSFLPNRTDRGLVIDVLGTDPTISAINGVLRLQSGTLRITPTDVVTPGSGTIRIGPDVNQISGNMIVGGSTSSPNQDITVGNIFLHGNRAFSGASTNINGGAITIAAGAGASASSGEANGGNVTIRGGTGYGTGRNGLVIMDNLPTANPVVAGALWNNAGVLSISAG